MAGEWMDNEMRVPQGAFSLQRFPRQGNASLRAWDAADEYLLHDLAELDQSCAGRIWILNDSFGALAVALSHFRPVSQSDSWLAQQATSFNLSVNHIPRHQVRLLNSLQVPDQPIDCLLIKVPKTLALLEYQLTSLQPWLSAKTRVIAGGMCKNLTRSVWEIMTRLVGPLQTTRARKKSRLIHATRSRDREVAANPYPVSYRVDDSALKLSNHANVFSRDRLDIGTRFLLRHLPDNPVYRELIDLGCGNGVVGIHLAQQYPLARIRFVDESFMATASARENMVNNCPDFRNAEFLTTHCLTGIAQESVDAIVCNPPFHQQHAVGDHIAWEMFRQSRQALRKGGELRIIGNRHLVYQNALKKLFGQCEMVASNKKFVILAANR